MRYRLLDLLRCPECGRFPLKLYVFEVEEQEVEPPGKPPLCELYCGYLEKKLEELGGEPPCSECIRKDVKSGLLYCEGCGAWYPIMNYIPRMLPRGHPLRPEKEYREFLSSRLNSLPEHVRKSILGSRPD